MLLNKIFEVNVCWSSKYLKCLALFLLMVYGIMQGILLTHGHTNNREEVNTAYERVGPTADNTGYYSQHCAVCDFIVQLAYNVSTSIFSFTLFAHTLFCWVIKDMALSAHLLSRNMQGRSPPLITILNDVD